MSVLVGASQPHPSLTGGYGLLQFEVISTINKQGTSARGQCACNSSEVACAFTTAAQGLGLPHGQYHNLLPCAEAS